MFTRTLRSAFVSFTHNQIVGGVLLLVCAVIALMVANIPSLQHLADVWNLEFGIGFADFRIAMPLGLWVNDGLMAVFFFVVGLEIKREIMVGELSSFKHATLPIFAALGGMIFPALIYAAFNAGTESSNGWGIPMATDIAFAIGILSLLGNRVPTGLKVFLTALAIVDDLGAIIVLAIFYPSHALHLDYLGFAAIVVLFLVLMNRLKVGNVLVYVIPGVVLWYFIYMSGIHATIAGVILAMTIPSRTRINEVRYYVRMKKLVSEFKAAGNSEVSVLANPKQQEIISSINRYSTMIDPLMHRFENGLHPVVTFVIMPLFALANAGVVFDAEVFSAPLPPVVLGIFFGLFVGKPLGIFLLSYIVVKLRIAELPQGTGWLQVIALGVVAGIGFTMSIFIDGLAFADQRLIDMGKATILITSAAAAVVGLLFMNASLGGKVRK